MVQIHLGPRSASPEFFQAPASPLVFAIGRWFAHRAGVEGGEHMEVRAIGQTTANMEVTERA